LILIQHLGPHTERRGQIGKEREKTQKKMLRRKRKVKEEGKREDVEYPSSARDTLTL